MSSNEYKCKYCGSSNIGKVDAKYFPSKNEVIVFVILCVILFISYSGKGIMEYVFWISFGIMAFIWYGIHKKEKSVENMFEIHCFDCRKVYLVNKNDFYNNQPPVNEDDIPELKEMRQSLEELKKIKENKKKKISHEDKKILYKKLDSVLNKILQKKIKDRRDFVDKNLAYSLNQLKLVPEIAKKICGIDSPEDNYELFISVCDDLHDYRISEVNKIVSDIFPKKYKKNYLTDLEGVLKAGRDYSISNKNLSEIYEEYFEIVDMFLKTDLIEYANEKYNIFLYYDEKNDKISVNPVENKQQISDKIDPENLKDAKRLIERGNAFKNLGHFDEAISNFNESIRLNPNNSDAYYNRGIVYGEFLQNYSQAISDFTQAIKLNSNNSDAYLDRGIVYGKFLQNYEQAISDFTQAIKINPNDADAYYSRGLAYSDLENYEQAISDFNQTVKLYPDYEQAYYNRGSAYLKLQNYMKAISDFNQVIKLNSNLHQAYYNRGNAYYYLQNYEKAISDYTQAINLNPNLYQAYYNRGNAYYHSQNYEKAISDFNKAIKLNPNDINALRNIEIIRKELAKNNSTEKVNTERKKSKSNKNVGDDFNSMYQNAVRKIYSNKREVDYLLNYGGLDKLKETLFKNEKIILVLIASESLYGEDSSLLKNMLSDDILVLTDKRLLYLQKKLFGTRVFETPRQEFSKIVWEDDRIKFNDLLIYVHEISILKEKIYEIM